MLGGGDEGGGGEGGGRLGTAGGDDGPGGGGEGGGGNGGGMGGGEGCGVEGGGGEGGGGEGVGGEGGGGEGEGGMGGGGEGEGCPLQSMRMACMVAGLVTSGVLRLVYRELALVPCVKHLPRDFGVGTGLPKSVALDNQKRKKKGVLVPHPLGKLLLAVGQLPQTETSAQPSTVAAALHSALSKMSKWPCSSQVAPWVTW